MCEVFNGVTASHLVPPERAFHCVRLHACMSSLFHFIILDVVLCCYLMVFVSLAGVSNSL